jgi:hypothetical protein
MYSWIVIFFSTLMVFLMLFGFLDCIYSPTISNTNCFINNFDAGKGILCYHHNGISPPVIQIACTHEVQGQYVKIYMEHNSLNVKTILTLCEVEVDCDFSF